MDSYLENAMDYVQETFESANEWMKENDPLKFSEVEAKESHLSLENIESKPILDEKLSIIGEVGEDQSSLSITEKINKGIDYIGSAVENANEWIKRNDPFKLPVVEAYGIDDIEVRHRFQGSPPPTVSDPSSAYMGGGDSSNLFSSFGNGIGQGNSFGSGDKFGASTSGASEPKWEPYPSIDL